jgi:hypothetical protein
LIKLFAGKKSSTRNMQVIVPFPKWPDPSLRKQELRAPGCPFYLDINYKLQFPRLSSYKWLANELLFQSVQHGDLYQIERYVGTVDQLFG